MNEIYKIKDNWLKMQKLIQRSMKKCTMSQSLKMMFFGQIKEKIFGISLTQIKDVLYSKEEVKIKWYYDGTTNVAYNCIDRHAENSPDKTAIIWGR